jgi:mRNA-degrading endonuclease HigB of HigAB toxin-antitoxin module
MKALEIIKENIFDTQKLSQARLVAKLHESNIENHQQSTEYYKNFIESIANTGIPETNLIPGNNYYVIDISGNPLTQHVIVTETKVPLKFQENIAGRLYFSHPDNNKSVVTFPNEQHYADHEITVINDNHADIHKILIIYELKFKDSSWITETWEYQSTPNGNIVYRQTQ